MITINAPVVNINVYKGNTAQILERLNEIMGLNQQASDKLDALGGKLDKVSGETTQLVLEVRALKDAALADNVSQALLDKIDALAGKADSIDAQVDDVAPNPTPTPDPDPAPPEDPDAGTTTSDDGTTPTP